MVNFGENGVTTPQKSLSAYVQNSIFLAHDVKYTSLTSKWPQKVFFHFFWPIMVNFGENRVTTPQKKFISVCVLEIASIFCGFTNGKRKFLNGKRSKNCFFGNFLVFSGQFWGKRGHGPPQKVYQHMRSRNRLHFMWVHQR